MFGQIHQPVVSIIKQFGNVFGKFFHSVFSSTHADELKQALRIMYLNLQEFPEAFHNVSYYYLIHNRTNEDPHL